MVAFEKASEFRYRRMIQFAETDMAGIMHYSNFFRLMEEAEHAFFRALGMSVHSFSEGRTVGWPRVKAECSYFKPLRYEDEVEVRVVVVEMGRKSMRYGFLFEKVGSADEKEVVARGMISTVCVEVEPEEGRLTSVEIPQKLRDQVQVASGRVMDHFKENGERG